MAFDPTKYKAPSPRRVTCSSIIEEHGYWCNSYVSPEGEKRYFLYKNEHSIEDTMLRKENSIQGRPGETLKEILTRLGWI